MDEVRIIAFYLPQFHPIKENNEWWGEGFTEWTNVAKAKPLFKGHYQPKIPADLGFYDLRIPEVRQKQAALAREAGVYGFCYWHYWFGEGKELLEMPFKEVLETGKPDFPFCLGWANESWLSKEWNTDKSATVKKVLIEQKYTGEEDHFAHFKAYEKAFRDNRYIKIDGRPLFLIYRPFQFDGLNSFLKQWNYLISKTGIADSFYFVAQANTNEEIDDLLQLGFDAVNVSQTARMRSFYCHLPKWRVQINKVYRKVFSKPLVLDYLQSMKFFWDVTVDTRDDVIPSLLPNWDHSPRSGVNSIVLNNSTPEAFGRISESIIIKVLKKKNKLIFLKSWNEWGEGNYMEPDLKYGKGYIQSLNLALDNAKKRINESCRIND